MTYISITHYTAVLLCGLSAGLFYGYDCSVIPGLGKLPDKEYLSAFQSINREIQNPYFFVTFMGCAIMMPLATWFLYKDGGGVPFNTMLLASLVYLVGLFGVTIAGNVPLNNMLDKELIELLNAEELRALRERFEPRWNMLHHIRTYAAIVAFLLAVVSSIKR